MLKAIHAQESRTAAWGKAQEVIEALKTMKLHTAAALVDSAVSETFTFYAYPPPHWLKIKTNNPMERLLKEVRRRTRVVGAFPDSHAALMLVSARLRHDSRTKWGTQKYMNMQLLNEMDNEVAYSAA